MKYCSLRRGAQALVAAAALATLAPAGQLWIVDAAGGGDFVDLQLAVDTAADGDLLLVRSGNYGRLVLNDRALTLTAENAHEVRTSTIYVNGLSAGKTLSLTGFTAQGSTSTNATRGAGLYARNCEGGLRLRDCELRGGEFPTPTEDFWPGARLEFCSNASLSSCELEGAKFTTDYALTSGFLRAGSGLESVDSRVALLGTRCVGGGSVGAGSNLAAAMGGFGAHTFGLGELFASDCTFEGGDGSGGNDCAYASDGGDGLHLDATLCRLLACIALEGEGGDCVGCGFTICDNAGEDGTPIVGAPIEVDGTSARLTAPRVARETGIPLQLNFDAVPGSQVFVLPATSSGFEYADRWNGVLLLAPPFLAPAHVIGGGSQLGNWPIELPSLFLGTLDASGSLTVAIPVTSFAPALGRRIRLQGAIRTPSGAVVLTDPVDVLLAACSTALADCDNDGITNCSAIASGASLDCDGNGVPDECQADCDASGVPDVCEIASGAATDCNENGISDHCEPYADCNGNGIQDLCDIFAGTSVDENGNGLPDDCEPVRFFVDASASPGGDGFGWATAFDRLEPALSPALIQDEIWVRAGTYAPQSGVGFSLYPDKRLYGGFSGTETQLGQRDPVANPTTLSGDRLGNDGPSYAPGPWADNALRVVQILGGGGQVLDGFTVRAGNADENFLAGAQGGGIRVTDHPTSLEDTTPVTIRNCTVIGNRAIREGGGLYIGRHRDVAIGNCRFLSNRGGFAVLFGQGDPSDGGGALYSKARSLQLVGCEFSGNISSGALGGSAMVISTWPGWQPGRVSSVTASGNHSSDSGAAIHVLFNGTTGTGPGVSLEHAVVWGNSNASGTNLDAQLSLDPSGVAQAHWSCVQGGQALGWPTLLDVDPLFLRPLGLDGVAGTIDDDLRLGAASPCVDAGRNALLPSDTLDLDEDGDTGETLPVDLAGAPRQVDDSSVTDTGLGSAPVVDLGAYERDPSAHP